MAENFERMLAGSLRLEEPWYILGAEFHEEEPAIHIHVGVDKAAALCCHVCGAPAKRYGYESKERIWRHADCLFYLCYVHCIRPRVLCEKCGAMQVNAPFERKNSRFTLLFEGYAMLLLQDVPRARAARLLRCDEKSLAGILTYWVHEAVNRMDLSDVSSVTIAIDADRRRAFDVEPGRAFRIVRSLDDFYAPASMDEVHEGCCLAAKASRGEILNFFHTRLTNAICEGINLMI